MGGMQAFGLMGGPRASENKAEKQFMAGLGERYFLKNNTCCCSAFKAYNCNARVFASPILLILLAKHCFTLKSFAAYSRLLDF
jgi:hypothetical protein